MDYKITNTDFVELVKETRKKKKLSLKYLSRQAGVNRNTLNGYLQGYNRMPLPVAERLCGAMNMELIVRDHD